MRTLIWLAVAGVYLALALPGLDRPVAGDEVMVLRQGIQFTRHGGPEAGLNKSLGVGQPLLYVYLAGWAGRTFPDPVKGARLLGLLFTLGGLGLIVWWAHAVAGPRAATVAGLLAAVNPIVVQGSRLVVYDTTVLPFGLLGWAALAWRSNWFSSHASMGIGGLLLALLLGLQIETPWLLLVATGVCAGVRSGWWAVRRIAATGLLGMLVFLAGWLVYCGTFRQVPGMPFQHARGLVVALHVKQMTDVVRGAGLAVIWATPSALLAFLVAARWRITQGRFSSVDLLAGFAVMLVAASAGLGMTTFNFPRYPAPALPGICLLTGVWVASETWRWRRAALACAAGLLVAVPLGDPLYRVVHEVRNEALVGHVGARGLARKGGAELAVGVLPAMAGRLVLGSPVGWVAGAIGAGLALCARQVWAEYQTGYTYGTRGVLEAAEIVRAATKTGGVALAPSEVLWYAGNEQAPYEARDYLFNRSVYLWRVKEARVRAVAYSLTTQSIVQMREIFWYPEVQTALRRRFEHRQVGDMTVWVRKPGGG